MGEETPIENDSMAFLIGSVLSMQAGSFCGVRA